MADDFESKSREFVAWFQALPGATLAPKIELADYRDRGAGRGVRAVRDIDADEELFSVSPASVMTLANSDLHNHLPNLIDEQEPWNALILALIYEYQLGQDSRWHAYFGVLPDSFDTLMFWSDEELKELQASGVLSKIGKQEATENFKLEILSVIRAHENVFKTASLSDETLLQLAHRMGSIIMAYAFDLEKQDVEPDEDGYATEEEDEWLPKGMVPMADMLNADAEPNASLFQESGMFTMKSLRHIPAGTEILNDYGQLPRSDLLRRYGYITPKYSRFDCVELSREWLDEIIFRECPRPDDMQERIECLVVRQLYDDSYDMLWPENSGNMDYFPDDLSRYVKTMLADTEKWKAAAKSGISDALLMRKFEAIMREAIKSRIAQYPTSLHEDLESLSKDHSLRGRKRLAVEVRTGEKQILHKALERLQDKLEGDGPASKRQRVV